MAAWEDIADRIRRGESSTWRDSAIPAADLPTPEVGQDPATDAREERIRALERENQELRVLLDSAVRAFRTVDGDLVVAREQVAAANAEMDKWVPAIGHDADGVRYDFLTRRSRPLNWREQAG
ncbi:hypothetical protein [Kutzneria buriramensis]|uniref:Uncharacterized protein n=1 Tax=Kutzneria buriramensis TaxID=1045776 RepID=A0A3E0I8Z6_9PSEU|nr:hypothetical protein [Kutzneria buriramensis]REH55192.1 hypothetical protein BCF44_101209 [Kutzneria buriramensis]